MSESFDAYHNWLGIPPEEQPPNHYRLLGLKQFESNADVICNAADRQMMLLRTFQTGQRAALSQELLNEVAAARVCLLNPTKKAAYDEQLRQQQEKSESAQPAAVPAPGAAAHLAGEIPPVDFQQAAVRPISGGRRPRRRKRTQDRLVIGLAAIVVCLGVAILAVLPRRSAESQILKLTKVSPQSVRQGELLKLTLGVEDQQAWQGRLTYSLAPGTPSGAKIDRQTGQFSWQPGKTGQYAVTVRVRAMESEAADEQTFVITVTSRPRPPVLASIPDQTVTAGEQFVLSAQVEDPGEPPAELKFSLAPGAPTGMQIDPGSGEMTWRPAGDTPAGEYRVTVCLASDKLAQLRDEKSFTIRVAAKQPVRPPVLAAIPDQTIEPGKEFTVTAAVEDPGEPAARLTFSLGPGAPDGMVIDPNSGTITWQPAKDHPPSEYGVMVVVASTAPGNPSHQKSFSIRIAGPPEIPDKLADKQRLAVPDEDSRQQALAKLKGSFDKEYGSKHSHVRLAMAGRLIQMAGQSGAKPVERFVMLSEAQDLARSENNCLLALAAVDRLASSFDVDGVQMKVDALSSAVRQAQMPMAMRLVAESAFALAEETFAEDSYDAVSSLLRQVDAAARKARDPKLAQWIGEQTKTIEERRRLFEASRAALATLSKAPGDQRANLELGRFYCLGKEDWDQGLPLLAKSGDQQLQAPAAQLVADRTDVGAQLALADAWWELAEKERGGTGAKLLMQAAARHWYEQALPRLADEDLAKVHGRLESPAASKSLGPGPPFLLSLGGLGGLFAVLPEKHSGKVLPSGGFATFGGAAKLEYAQVPASSYVHELELAFAASQGSMSLTYGEPYEGVGLSFAWEEEPQKFRCRLIRYRGGVHYWGRTRHYDPGQRLRFTFYVNENQQTLYQEGTPILRTGVPVADLHFRLSASGNTMATIHSCRFRRWTQLDADRLKCPLPPTRVKCDLPQTALRLCQRNLNLAERPVVNDPKPFVVHTTGTPMEWIPSGSFRLHYSDAKKQPTEVTISYGFWIGRYEVTQGEWMALVPTNVSRVVGSPFLPVEGVSWEDAVKFCALLTERERRIRRLPAGYQYRLPTEAEWEYAARAGSDEDFSVPPDGFWAAENGLWRPHEVGEGKPNAWGLYDMHGNVYEWCFDAWQDEAATPAWRVTDPVWFPQNSDGLFALRGGGWWTPRSNCSSPARTPRKSVAGGHRGFRIVLGPILRGK